MALGWAKPGPRAGRRLIGSFPIPSPPAVLPLTYQGTGLCCRTWFASPAPRRGCLQTGGACRCAYGPGSRGRRCWSTSSKATTRPRRRALRGDPRALLSCATPGPEAPPPVPRAEAPPPVPRPAARAHLDTRQSCCTGAARAGARCTACCRRRTRRSACESASPRRTCWSTRSTGTTPPPRGHLRAQTYSITGVPLPLNQGGGQALRRTPAPEEGRPAGQQVAAAKRPFKPKGLEPGPAFPLEGCEAGLVPSPALWGLALFHPKLLSLETRAWHPRKWSNYGKLLKSPLIISSS